MKLLIVPILFLALSLPSCKPLESKIPTPPGNINLPQNIVLSPQQLVVDEKNKTPDPFQESSNTQGTPDNRASVEAKFATFEVEINDPSSSSTESAPLKRTATFRGQLFPQIAPATVANFEQKANSGVYDNLMFHRIEDWVAQGGDPKGDGTGGEKMRTELNAQQFIPGSIGMARGNEKEWTNDMQFFIVKKQVFGLDKEYANFGLVIEGGDVVASLKKGDRIVRIRVE
ncbi:MAG: peptidylprolyl isomerase [bacterium]|nr:peptidylprolyl isomerase [bacterium]